MNELQRIRQDWEARGAPDDDVGRLLRLIPTPPPGPFRTWRQVATVLGISENTLAEHRRMAAATARLKMSGTPRRPWERPHFSTPSQVWDWWEATRVRVGSNSPRRPEGV